MFLMQFELYVDICLYATLLGIDYLDFPNTQKHDRNVKDKEFRTNRARQQIDLFHYDSEEGPDD